MKFSELPLFADTYYSYVIGLDGVRYTFDFLWLERDKGWHINIKDDSSRPIIMGYKLVQQYLMMADYALQGHGLKGYFLLLPRSEGVVSLNQRPSNLSQFYRLYYIY